MFFESNELFIRLLKLKLEIILKKVEYARAADGKQNLETVVVEHDWPMYDKTWKDIEKFSKSKKAKVFVKTSQTLERERLDALAEIVSPERIMPSQQKYSYKHSPFFSVPTFA